MALNPATAANPIAASYLTYVADRVPSGNYQQTFGNSYKMYSQAGVLSAGGGTSGSENASIIINFLNTRGGNTTVTAFATMFANYWASCLLVPSGGATDVVNNAASLVSVFESAITASIRDTDTQPYFTHLISNIQTIALPSVVWTVTLPFPPYTRLESVS